ncbi:hypothetical protein AB4Y93_01155 [Paenibacillus sp. YAF4_2]
MIFIKRLGLMLFLVAILLATGCQSNNSNNELDEAQKKIDKSNLAFEIPKLDGYEVSYVHHVFPPQDKQGNVLGNKQEVFITYTDNKGKLNKLTNEQKGNDEREILYGPYQGDTKIELTYSTIQSNLEKSEMVEMDGEKVQRVKIGEHTFFLFNGDKGSITMNYSNLDEATMTSITQQVIKESK